jgi:ribosomal protein S18 acetylase RimI-like enzyme
MPLTIELHPRPREDITGAIVHIAELLTEHWFTPNVPEDTRRDLLFQDALCLYEDEHLRAFLVFTSWDGDIQITLMGTHPQYHHRGYASILMEHFFQHVQTLGFDRIIAMTVPADVKPSYAPTIAFYKKHGFMETRRFTELWEQGALELVKTI